MTRERHRILLAEDTPGFARVIQFNLEKAGFEVTLATDGRKAWEIAQQDEFDVVLTDQQMPETTGTELCAQLRELPAYETTPVMLLSAKGLELDAEHLESVGITKVLPKPLSPSELIRTLEETLATKTGQPT